MNPPDLAPLLEGVFWQAAYKLMWADDQFRTALAVFDGYNQNGGTGFRERFNPDAGVYITELYAELLPYPLPMAIGSGIHSLRSALDTAVSTIVHHAGGRQDNRYSFPVHATRRELEAAFEPGTRTCPDCKAERATKAPLASLGQLLPDFHKLLFEDFRPWEDGNFPLWALSKLDNLQKHQMLITVLTTTSGNIDFNTLSGVSARNNLWRIGAGQTIEIFRSAHPLIVTNKPAVATDLRFPQGVPFAGEPVFEVLSQLFKLVRGILITLQANFEGGKAAPAPGA